MINGSTRFNDIHRGVPLISRSLLSARLKELEAAKSVVRSHSARSGHGEYSLTTAGRFEFTDWEEGHRYHWLVIERDAIDLCYIDPGHDVDVWIKTNLRTMVEVWMNWASLPDACVARDIVIAGAPNLTRDPLGWLGQSPLAGVKQRPSEEQVGRLLKNVRA